MLKKAFIFRPYPLCKLVMDLKFLVDIKVFLMYMSFDYELSFVKNIQSSHSRLIITLIRAENFRGRRMGLSYFWLKDKKKRKIMALQLEPSPFSQELRSWWQLYSSVVFPPSGIQMGTHGSEKKMSREKGGRPVGHFPIHTVAPWYIPSTVNVITVFSLTMPSDSSVRVSHESVTLVLMITDS